MSVNEEIKKYTEYCLNCKIKPCSQKGCPLSNDIPQFISLTKQGNIKEAYNVLTKTTMLGGICGQICPHEKQCQGSCVRGLKGDPVNIGEIESYIFNKAIEMEYDKQIERTNQLDGKKIAVIGGGPSGLNCAAFLARAGAQVTIYEKQEKLGGIIRYGIPDFRLDKTTLDKTIQSILNLGIMVEYKKSLGDNLNLKELQQIYDAIFIGIGANIPSKMNIQGEELLGVYGGNTLLETNNHPNYLGKKVAIIGGGNVAIDCARTVQRLGTKEVVVIYRRAEKQMPAEKKEIEYAKKEGVKFLFQNNITKILGDNKVEQIECIKTELVKKEGEERETPIDIPNSNYILDVDYVIMAVGSKPPKQILEELNINLLSGGYIKVNERYQTSEPKIYAGGDLIGQKATVAWAAKSGRQAAECIIQDLTK